MELSPPADPFTLDPAEIATRVAAAGIVGMGGATFPSAVKLNLRNRYALHTLVINGAECEPYLTCDDRVMREYSADVIDGCRIMAYALGVENIVIGIENNKPEAQAAMRAAATAFPNVQVVGLPMRYPMGSEKHLVQTLTGKETPARGLTADILGKQVFGGIGQNLFNPATVARVALLISFPLEMTTWAHPSPLFSASGLDFTQGLQMTFGGWSGLDGYSGATTLGHIRTETGQGHTLSSLVGHLPSLSDMTLGMIGGSMGETSTLLLLGGGLFLLWKRVITWHIPVSMIAALLLLAGIMHTVNPDVYPGIEVHLLAGATLLGAFFIATDLVTSPVSPKGQLVFGAGCGLLVYVIRTWAGYPEGMAFAVLLMNAVTPLIDHYFRPRIYGRDRKGEPLQYGTDNGGKV